MYSRRHARRAVWKAALRSDEKLGRALTWWEVTLVVLFALALIGRLAEWLIGSF